MLRLIFTYGAIAGFVIIVSIILSIEVDHGHSWLGYLIMFIAFSMIFVGVKRYRDETLGGVISFATALLMGLGISAIAGIVYVAIWELYLILTDFQFIDAYANAMVASAKAGGGSDAEVAQILSDVEKFRTQYSNPIYRWPQTAMEVLPPGVLVSFLSAIVLRNHKSAG